MSTKYIRWPVAIWVSLAGALAVVALGALVIFKTGGSAPAATGDTPPLVPEAARLVRSPIRADPAQIAAGRQLYLQNCAPCHGESGQGNGPAAAALSPKPADLTVHAPQHTEGELYWWVTNGIPTTAMPAWTNYLSDLQRWQIVAFIKTFGVSPQASAATPAAVPPGLIFFAHPAPDLNLALTVTPPLFQVQVADADGQPVAGPARVDLQFTWLDQDAGTSSVSAVRDAQGRWTATDDALTRPGLWRVRVVVPHAGQDVAVDWPLSTGPPSAAAGIDPNAVDLLKASDAQMNRLTTLRSRQELNDGKNAVVVTNYEYQAPNRLRFQVIAKNATESIAVGGMQYDLDQGKWSSRVRVEPFVFPHFTNADGVIEAKLGRRETLGGVPMQIVETTVADGPVHYAYWISLEDHLVHQLAMVASAHYMMEYYFDYDAPLQIQVPPQ